MNDLVDICRIEGEIMMDGQNIYDKSVDVSELRRSVGMVFQKPNPFPKTIYENVAYGLRLQGVKDRRILDEVVETSLKGALHFGTKLKTVCTTTPLVCRAVNNSG